MNKKKSQYPGETKQAVQEMQAVDVRTVDKNTLVDIATVTLNENLPRQECIREYIRQIKNPYCYLSNGVVIKVSFAGKRSIEDCLKNAMFGTN